MGLPTTALNLSQRQGNLIQGNGGAYFSDQLLEKARADNAAGKLKAMVSNTLVFPQVWRVISMDQNIRF